MGLRGSPGSTGRGKARRHLETIAKGWLRIALLGAEKLAAEEIHSAQEAAHARATT